MSFNFIKSTNVLILLVLFVSFTVLRGQDVLIEDVAVCPIPGSWDHFIDTLVAHGVIIHYTSEEGYENILEMDMLWLNDIHGSFDTCNYTAIIEFARHGGNILVWEVSTPFFSTINILFNNRSWKTTLEIQDTLPAGVHSYPMTFFRFAPFTNELDTADLSGPTIISCGSHTYPFAFGNDNHIYPHIAISYPFVHEGNCHSLLVLATGTDHLQIWSIWRDYEYYIGKNLLLTTASVPGYELEPCAIPEPFIIQVDSCPNCANPGDTITLTGNNLWQGANENIGGDIEIDIGDTVIIPIEYSHYSPNCSTLTDTWLKFICPELPNGIYFIQLGHKAILFDGGEIQIPCEATYEPDSCIAHPLPFSPNGDGFNDYCKFEYPGMSEDNGVVSIYNLENTLVREVRNGDVEYSSKGTITWDGKDSEGDVVNNGVYVYVVEADGRIVCNGTVYVVK